jgi:SAM-dependent methyltransferase
MPALAKPGSYYAGCNEALLRAVPSSALRILEVGCAEGKLGAALKQQDPRRQLFGIEREAAVATLATGRLDRVFTLDVECDDPPLKPQSLDCILYGDVLEHLVGPGEVLRRHRRLLKPGGIVLCSVPNVQHHSLLAALLRGDWQYTTAGLLDSTHLRFFSYSTFFKMLLDAGFAPSLADVVSVPCSPAFLAAAKPLLHYLGLHSGRTEQYLAAYQYIVRGQRLADLDEDGATTATTDTPLSFVVCVSDDATLQANLLSSPCLAAGSPHEVLLVRGCANAAAGLNLGLERARHALVIGVHQDVYLPQGWPQRFLHRYRQAEKSLGKLGAAGVYGVRLDKGTVRRAGHVVDRDRLLWEPEALPTAVETLDELLLAVPRPTPLRFDPVLGFHFYGADLCLAARQRGLSAAVLDALCFHNSRSVGLTPEFHASGRVFARKWAIRLPVATSCALVDHAWLDSPARSPAARLAVPAH